ncbi:SLACS reverse transcriptase, putative, (fragment), partial [Trypanosoma vivax Y486]
KPLHNCPGPSRAASSYAVRPSFAQLVATSAITVQVDKGVSGRKAGTAGTTTMRTASRLQATSTQPCRMAISLERRKPANIATSLARSRRTFQRKRDTYEARLTRASVVERGGSQTD